MRVPLWAPGNERLAPPARRSAHRRPGRLAALSAAALAAAAMAGCGSSPSGASASGTPSSSSGNSSSGSAKGSPYTIHAILSLTGSAGFVGSAQKKGLLALAMHINTTGGIQGHPLKFAISDNQTTASTSVSLASPLVSQVPILIVGTLTTTDRPVDDLVTSSGPVIYDLSPGDHPKRDSYVYSTGVSTTALTQAFINFAQSKGWKHVAAITSTDASGQDGWTNIQKAVAGSHGAVTITDHETFAPNAVSVTTQLSKIKASNPQALLIWTTGTPLGVVLKGMQELGMDSLPTMTTNGNVSYAEMQRLASELPAQLYFPGGPFLASPSVLAGPEKSAVQAFDSTLRASNDRVPGIGESQSWDVGLILVSALRKLGVNATASQIHSYIDSLTSLAGAQGTYNFTDPSIPDNRGLGISSVYIARWSKSQGHWVAVSGPAGKGT